MTAAGRFLGEDPARDGENWYAYAGNNPINFTDPTGLYITDGGDPVLNQIVDLLNSRSPTFRAVYRQMAESKDMVFQFSNKFLRDSLGETDLRMVKTQKDGVPALTLDKDGNLVSTVIPGGRDIPVAFMNVDVAKTVQEAQQRQVDPVLALEKTVSHEAAGHGFDALVKGFSDWWKEVASESKTPYDDRPSEQRANAKSDKVLSEV